MLAAKKIHAAILSKRRDKEEEDGVATMCKMMEDMRKEALNKRIWRPGDLLHWK